MSQKFNFYPQLHIASLSSQTSWHHLAVHTLLQDPLRKQPSINAYLGARYSRSADSVVEIAKEVLAKDTDAASRLEAIFQNYGHKSVGDMADVFVCIENVPMITAMRLFYRNPVVAGQERSTRFQNFADPKFVKLPITKNSAAKTNYEKIILKQMADYRELLPLTQTTLADYFKIDTNDKRQAAALQARTFDTARYLLPMGLQTSLGMIMSARNWAELIALLKGSAMGIDQHLGNLLFDLLVGGKQHSKTGYIPEADGLIRHTTANTRQTNSNRALIKQLRSLFKKSSANRTIGRSPNTTLRVAYNTNAFQAYLRHLQLLEFPLSRENKFILSRNQLQKIGALVFSQHNHHFQIGPAAQSGAITIEGMADFGILKDLNRHRSLERFVPIWQDEINLEAELNRDDQACFFLCDYLAIPELKPLKRAYQQRLSNTYQLLKKWRYQASHEFDDQPLVDEYTKYLLPHAHATTYRFYGSIDDLQYLIHLRTRPGGHIAYRSLTYAWLKKLQNLNNFWHGMDANIPPVDSTSREQFLDRG